MSTKEQRREKEETIKVTPSSTAEFATSPSYVQQREEQQMKQERIFPDILKWLMNIKSKLFKQQER